MRFKIYTFLVLTITIINAQSLGGNDFVGNIYNYGDNMASASEFYSHIYTPPSDSAKSSSVTPGQSQQIPSNTQETAYSHYTSPYASPHTSYNPFRVPHLATKTYATPAETIITPVQHSTVIHHTPYLSSITSQSPPFVGKLVYVNGKPSPPAHVHVQPVINPNPPMQHPLQKPLHYQRHRPHPLQSRRPQRFRSSPSPQLQQAQQDEFVPIVNPVGRSHVRYITRPQQEAPLLKRLESSKKEERDEDEDKEDVRENERERLREQNNDDEEEENEKGELNEDNEEVEEDSNDRDRYRNEEVEENDEEEEEERPKYRNYSFGFDSSSPQKSKQNAHRQHHHRREEDDEERDDDRRGGYKTHEDIAEDEDEDSNEDSSKVSYNKYVLKKVPKGFKIDKFEKQPPVSKSPYKSFTPDKQQFDHERVSITTLRPFIQGKTLVDQANNTPKSKPREDRGDKDDVQGRQSNVAPTMTKHLYTEKWFIMKKV